MGIIFIFVYLAMLGDGPWQYMLEVYGDPHAYAVGIVSIFMGIFTESRSSPGMAYVMTLGVAITIFGGVFSVLYGFGYLSYAAAKEGTFWLRPVRVEASFVRLRLGFPTRSVRTLHGMARRSCVWLRPVCVEASFVRLRLGFPGRSVRTLNGTVRRSFRLPRWPLALRPRLRLQLRAPAKFDERPVFVWRTFPLLLPHNVPYSLRFAA